LRHDGGRCGGDGNVYVSCYEGLTFTGRGNRWKKIYDGGISLGFKDMVWHEGKAWCTNDNGVWTIEDGKLTWAKSPRQKNIRKTQSALTGPVPDMTSLAWPGKLQLASESNGILMAIKAGALHIKTRQLIPQETQ
jgi:hypothetical protein